MFAPFVARFLHRLGVRARDDLEDLVQEVFLVTHRRGGYKPGAAHPTTWLAEIAVRVLADMRRKRRRRPLDLDEVAVESAVAHQMGPFDIASTARQVARVHAVLETCDLDHRAVFVLFELEGRSCEDIAAGFNIPLGTVYSRLHKVRDKLRRDFQLRELMELAPICVVAQPVGDRS